ncbi:carboxymuconolactone decarboxylase [Sinirhodobacter populi]|uniref:Carboxymuconolactone decarboxylase n=2 Tax=Paenirhodobacter populi TaxID=2306993 RepID=A0A443K8M7_9RHOB|nr:carboxymuconolactone decarboxylase [Sinirhodobacter populi]
MDAALRISSKGKDMAHRLERIDPAQASGEQLEVVTRLGAGRGRIPTPFNIWLHNPRLAAGMEIIGTYIDHAPGLSEAENEVAILATAVFWNAPYVIANHSRHARKAGVPEDVVEALLDKRRPTPDEGRIGTVCAAVWDLLEGGTVEDAQFERYIEILGRAAIAELLVVIGYFTSVSLAMTFHALEPKA